MKMRKYWEDKAIKAAYSADNLFKSYWVKRYVDNLEYVKRGNKILDIGCGDAKYFVKLVDKFEEFFGLELSPIHLEVAKKVFPEGNYVVANGISLPFHSVHFDAIISFGAFEHNDNIDTIFMECYRILDKNGILLFSVPNYISPWFPYLYIMNSLKKHDRVTAIGHHYSKRFLKTKLRAAGFSQVKFVDTIYAAPISIVGIGAGLVKSMITILKRRRINEESKESIGRNDTILLAAAANLDYSWGKMFYPLEYLGFGFMRLVLSLK